MDKSTNRIHRDVYGPKTIAVFVVPFDLRLNYRYDDHNVHWSTIRWSAHHRAGKWHLADLFPTVYSGVWLVLLEVALNL